MKRILLFAFSLFFSGWVFGQAYTLQDGDVTISDGVITACDGYDFSNKDIIIPDSLQGQRVIGIADKTHDNGIFGLKGLTSVQLPQYIEVIGAFTFQKNNIVSVDFSSCPNLQSINKGAFHYNQTITSVDFTGCTNLDSINEYSFEYNLIGNLDLSDCSSLTKVKENAFGNNQISTLNLSGCSSLNLIGDEAFYRNLLTSINFNGCIALQLIDHSAFSYNSTLTTLNFDGCSALTTIGEGAFSSCSINTIDFSACSSLKTITQGAFETNDLITIDLSPCTQLTYIGREAFYDNTLTQFNVPVNPLSTLYGWRDARGNLFPAGSAVTDLEASYMVPVPYTLTNADVEVTGGIITSCSYSFEKTDIIIPQTLHSETIIGIENKTNGNGVFESKDITSIKFPSTIEFIGNYAFKYNSIYNLDFSNFTSLTSIGVDAFRYNSDIDFDEACLHSINFTGCTSLTTIADGAFGANALKGILDLSDLTNLISIGEYAFSYDGYGNLNSINFSNLTKLTHIGRNAFRSHDIKSLDLSPCNHLEVIDGYAFEGCDSLTSVNLMNCDSLRIIGDNAFEDCEISTISITNCSRLERIGEEAFSDNKLDGNLDLTSATALTEIGYRAFYRNLLDGVDFTNCLSLSRINDQAFRSNDITGINLMNCTRLTYVGSEAFYYNNLGNFRLPNVSIPNFIFNGWQQDDYSGRISGGSYVSNLRSKYTADLIPTYTATFNVSDGSNPIEGATISLDGYGDQITNSSGVATFNVVDNDSIYYIVTEPNSIPFEDSISVSGAPITENVILITCATYLTVDSSICAGEVVSIGDSIYDQNGSFVTTFLGANQQGCDSVVTLNLTLLPNYEFVTDDAICDGETYNWRGNSYTIEETYYDSLQSQYGCDSVYVLNLTVDPVYNDTFEVHLCEGKTYSWDGDDYTTPGFTTKNYISAAGCDSFVTLDLKVSTSYCITYVPDDSLEYALVELGLDVLPLNDSVPTGHIDTLTSLNLNNKGITDLTGIEDFAALQSFACRSNQLTSIDVSQNTALTWFSCMENQLTILILGNNTNLTTLYCNNNQLSNIDVSQNTALTTFYCYNNQLTNLDVSNNTSLEKLSCYNNDLTLLDLNANTSLQELLCYQNNNLSTLNLSTNTDLLRLNCGNCGLTKLDVSNNAKLISLVCSDNSIDSLDIRNNPDIYHLLCPGNQLEYLDLRNGNMPDFDYMQATNNPLLSCIAVDDESAATAKTGWYKDANAEYRHDCRPRTYVPDDNFEQALIDAGYDDVGILDDYVPTEGIDTITNLDIHGEAIDSLIGIEDFVALEILDCGVNNITILDLSSNTNLVELTCRLTNITSLDLSNNLKLERLNCNSCDLVNIDVSKNTALSYINCNLNDVVSLDARNLTALTHLDIGTNALTSLYLNNGENHNLSFLDITDNPDLTCVMVDDVTQAENKTTLGEWQKDATAFYSLDCRPMTYVPDDNFEAELIALGLDDYTGLADYVPTEAIDTLQYLNVYSKSIDSLTGIEDFIALTELNCGSNNIDTLDLSKNTALITLICPSNNITSLDLSSNLDLEYLKCPNNDYLSTLNISQNTKLKFLQCSEANSSLTTLDVSNNTALEYLYCSYNAITSLDLSNNIALKRVRCNYNGMNSLKFGANTQLEYLKCTRNHLTSLDVSTLTALDTFSCGDNDLISLDLSNNPNLEIFICHDNVLTELSIKNGNNNNLVTFFADGNPDLFCIDVDDTIVANANYLGNSSPTGFSNDIYPAGWYKDDQSEYSLSCMPDCEFQLSSLTDTVGPEADLHSVKVIVNDERCTWSASEGSYWVSISSGKSGTGNGTVYYKTLANTSATPRSYTMNIAGFRYTVVQLGCDCTYTLSATVADIGYEGCDSAFTVTTPNGCDWTSTASCDWITITSGSGTGNGTVQFSVTQNLTSEERSCEIEVEGQIFLITQEANQMRMTYVPDDGFEQALIDLGYDDVLDDSVKTINIDTIASLDVSGYGISDLTGVEDFISLQDFNCADNKLIFISLKPLFELPFIDSFSNNFTYAPQSDIGIEKDTTINSGDSIKIKIPGYILEYQDLFSWFKDSVEIGLTDILIDLASVEYADSGTYFCQITNPIAPDLTLSTRPVTLRVITPVGITNLQLPELNIYPNPASRKVMIETGIDHSVLLELFDISGELKLQIKEFNTSEIDVSGYAKGVYLIRIADQNHIATKRLIVK